MPQNQDLRARLAGRAGFVLVAFLIMLATLVLLDRIGMPESVVVALGVAFILLVVTIIAFLPRSTRKLQFFAADHLVPSTYGGLAVMALAAGLLAPLAPPSGGGPAFAVVAAGFGLGLLGLALFTGPAMRRTGAFSLSDLLAARFPAPRFRLALALIVAPVCFALGLGGLEQATGAFEALGLGRWEAAVLSGAGIVLLGAPGGLASVVWTAAAAAVVLLFSLAAPAVASLARGQALPLPLLGDAEAWGRAGAIMADWSGVAIGQGDAMLALAVAFGVMALTPLLGPSIAVSTGAHAVRAGLKGLLLSGLALALAAATLAAAVLSFDARIVGARSDSLPDRVYAASATGRMDLCGARAANVAEARKACAALPGARLARKDVAPKSTYFFSAYADLLGLGASIRGLAAAAVAVVGLALAAASFLGLATALGHDLLFRLPGFPVLASARIAATRALLTASAAAGAAVAARGGVDPKLLFGAALAVSACFIWPLMALAAVPRAGSRDAALALAVAAVVGAAMLLLLTPIGVGRGAWGLPVVLAALAGASAGVVSGLMRADAAGGGVVMGRDLHGEAEAP